MSLYLRTALMIFGGVLMTFLLYRAIIFLGDAAVDRFYMSEASVSSRNERLSEDFQAFVSRDGISSDQFDDIILWFNSGVEADMIIYEADGAFDVGVWGHERLTEAEFENGAPQQWGYTFFDITFANGTRRVAIADCSDLYIYEQVRIFAMIVAFVVFVGSLFAYTRRIARLLRNFTADVSTLSRPQADHIDEKRTIRELSILASEVNRMHDIITDHTHSAQDALQANRELITALSHDIRNPLTSLIGYLDLLGMEEDALTETQRQYLAASTEKADRIRALTSEMFRYFLLFSGEKPPVQTERVDAQILLEQMLGEHAIDLESRGFLVHSDALQTPCEIDVDIQMLHRVFDNLFSNIGKYADPAEPIELSAAVQEGRLHVFVRNAVNPAPRNNVESNHVGLRTCAAIMELLGGTFRAEEQGGVFTAELTLPMEPESETES